MIKFTRHLENLAWSYFTFQKGFKKDFKWKSELDYVPFNNSFEYMGSVAERSKALVLGTSLFGGVGSNPTAATGFET